MCINRVYDEVSFFFVCVRVSVSVYVCALTRRLRSWGVEEGVCEGKSMANYTRSAGPLYSMAAIS